MTNQMRLVGFLLLGFSLAACSGDSPTDAKEESPRVETPLLTTAPVPPADLKVVCTQSTDVSGASATCPVVAWRGVTYWAFSHMDNRSAMTIVAYNAAGDVRGQLQRDGARYLSQITVDEAASTVTLVGQAGATITLTFAELRSIAP